jgi:alcohol dehydrogenase
MLAFTVRNRKLIAVTKRIPKLRPGWALLRVRLAGICNTDVEILRGYHAFRGTPGHEFVGEVAEVHGVSVRETSKWLGRRVVGEINVACSAYGFRPVCDFCRHGLKRHCVRRTVLGIVAHDGAFAEYLALPLENLHVVPDSVSDQEAVFVEPLAAACEILDQVNVSRFREAAVLGDGKLAQLIARVLHTKVRRVVMFGKHEKKLALALRRIRDKACSRRYRRPEACERKVSVARRSDRLTDWIRSRSTNDRAARHAGAQIHLSRRRACGNLAHRR